MIGPILVAISWVLLRLHGAGLGAIGINQPRRRLGEFALGFLFLGTVSAIQQLGLAAAAGEHFVWNPALDPAALPRALRANVNSVLFEELLFRGYALWLAIRVLGAKRAVLLDAAVFGIYHWFSYGVFGNPIAMAFVFILTGAYGLMWARAFVATGSVAAPIGLHLGTNAIAYLVFSGGPFGPGLFVLASGGTLRNVRGGWLVLILNLLLPLAATFAALWYFKRIEPFASAGSSGSPA